MSATSPHTPATPSPPPSAEIPVPPGDPAAGDPAAGELQRGPYRTAIAALVATVLTIVLGGMTTSTGSGMAFYDWPLADGSLWPPDMTLGGYFEHLHRYAATSVGFLVLIIVYKARHQAPWVRRCTIALLGVVVTQGLFGGFGVLNNLPHVTSVTHGVLAQLTFGFTAFLAFAFSPAWGLQVAADAGHVRAARKLVVLTWSFMVLQLLMGALVRHTGSMHALWGHVGFALVVTIVGTLLVASVGGRFKHVPSVHRASKWVGRALLLQILLGFTALAVRMDKHPENIQFLWRCTLRTSHLVVGALLLMSTAYLAYRLFRTLVPTEPSVGERA